MRPRRARRTCRKASALQSAGDIRASLRPAYGKRRTTSGAAQVVVLSSLQILPPADGVTAAYGGCQVRVGTDARL
jgi:hypothetical protein